jgi:photosystem II stability/assembly factor-like uncharacterized protein
VFEPTGSACSSVGAAVRRFRSNSRNRLSLGVIASFLVATAASGLFAVPHAFAAPNKAVAGAVRASAKSAVIDYSSGFAASTPARLKRAGVGVVIRYVGSSTWKCLTPSEASALRAAGIDIATVYESTAGWMLGGHNAGVAAAKAARAAIVADGGPKRPFVYFACDTDTNDYSAVNAALKGGQSVLGADKVGIYGGYAVCQSAIKSGSAAKAWQTVAWSNGQVLKQAALLQLIPRELGNLGVDYDSNVRHAADVGQWGAASSEALLAVPASEIASFAAQSAPTTETLRAIESTDGVSAWIVGDGGSILHTASGGTTWTVQSTPTTASLDAVDFSDGLNGWAVGTNGTVFHTADGGLVWDGQSTPTTATLRAVSFADPEVGWAVGDHGAIIHTTNGGQNWVAQSAPTTTAINSVRFSSESTGMALGEDGQMLFTDSGGSTWFSASTATTETLRSLSLDDTATAWSVGASGTVLCTRDGGAIWTRQSSPTTSALSSVSFADPWTGVAVGSTGTVLVTRDRGQTWGQQSVPSTATLHAVDVVGTKGWAIGELGTILHFTLPAVPQSSTYSGASPDGARAAPGGKAVVKAAETWIGVNRYAWGTFDCSSFVADVAQQIGVSIPAEGTSVQMPWYQSKGLWTTNPRDAQPGDQLFFASSASPSGRHTGIYIGRGLMVDNSGTGVAIAKHPIAGRTLIGIGKLSKLAATPSEP